MYTSHIMLPVCRLAGSWQLDSDLRAGSGPQVSWT